MEKITYLPNGQWLLEKGVSAKEGSKYRNWMHTSNRENLKNLPPLVGKQKHKALQLIQDETVSRINPETGEKEYKLFRAAPANEPYWEDGLSSWSTYHNMAHHWGSIAAESDEAMVHHAWVPEKYIHSHVNVVAGEEHEKGGESEVLVHPHKMNIFNSEKPINPMTPEYEATPEYKAWLDKKLSKK